MGRALVIDDSAIDRKLIVHILDSLGIQSIQAIDGEEGYSVLLENSDVTLLFIDWNMPLLNGLELIQMLRSERRFDRLKLIMVTATTEMSEIKTALHAGVDEYIMKPLDREVFRQKLELLNISLADEIIN